MSRLVGLRAAVASWACSCTSATSTLPVGALEEPVCGSCKEWLAFSLWSRAAARARGALLVAQGNAMLADHRLRLVADFLDSK